MCNDSSTTGDEFQQRLEASLSRLRRQQDTPLVDPPAESDKFEERLRRAAESVRGTAEPAQPNPAPRTGEETVLRLDGLPADLRTVVESWPRLSGFVRAFILNMVQANRDPQAAA